MRISKIIAFTTIIYLLRIIILIKTLISIPKNLLTLFPKTSNRLIIILSDSTITLRRSNKIVEF